MFSLCSCPKAGVNCFPVGVCWFHPCFLGTSGDSFLFDQVAPMSSDFCKMYQHFLLPLPAALFMIQVFRNFVIFRNWFPSAMLTQFSYRFSGYFCTCVMQEQSTLLPLLSCVKLLSFHQEQILLWVRLCQFFLGGVSSNSRPLLLCS